MHSTQNTEENQLVCQLKIRCKFRFEKAWLTNPAPCAIETIQFPLDIREESFVPQISPFKIFRKNGYQPWHASNVVVNRCSRWFRDIPRVLRWFEGGEV